MTEPYIFQIKYNSITYDLINYNSKLEVIKKNKSYTINRLSKKIPIIKLNYDDYEIITNNIHHIYVILQKIMKTNTIKNLSKCKWNYNKWNVSITSIKKLPDWCNILNCLLNLNNNFNKPIKINELEKIIKLNDKRGWSGERPREIYYKLGFPWYTPKTKKSLKMCERLFECPFPICNINPRRNSILIDKCKEIKCFTCGVRNNEKNFFGNLCTFEKAHLDAHMNGNKKNLVGYQCKWCNTFYKDKITWNIDSGKPKFNIYGIIRDAPKKEVINILKKLGFSSSDLK